MTGDDHNEQADIAREEAAQAETPEEALAWLKVAAAWEELAPQQAGPVDGFARIEVAYSNETARLIIRIAEEGNCEVVLDRRYKAPVVKKASSIAQAVQRGLEMVDESDKNV